MSGYAGILVVRTGAVTRVPYDAVAPPAWLPDNDTVLLSGLPASEGSGGSGGSGAGDSGQPAGLLTPGTSVEPLSPKGLHLTVAERASLRIGALREGGAAVRPVPLHDGGTLPEVDGDGHVAYLVLDARLPDAGRIWMTPMPLPESPGSPVSTQVVPDNRALESSVSFAPQAFWLVVSREPLPGVSPSASPRPLGPSPTPTPSPNPSALPTP